jgi:hypothetical protein
MTTWTGTLAVMALVAAGVLAALDARHGMALGVATLWASGWIHGMAGLATQTTSWRGCALWAFFGWLVCTAYCVMVREVCEIVEQQIVPWIKRQRAEFLRHPRRAF